jgi:hypothetical protein
MCIFSYSITLTCYTLKNYFICILSILNLNYSQFFFKRFSWLSVCYCCSFFLSPVGCTKRAHPVLLLSQPKPQRTGVFPILTLHHERFLFNKQIKISNDSGELANDARALLIAVFLHQVHFDQLLRDNLFQGWAQVSYVSLERFIQAVAVSITDGVPPRSVG